MFFCARIQLRRVRVDCIYNILMHYDCALVTRAPCKAQQGTFKAQIRVIRYQKSLELGITTYIAVSTPGALGTYPADVGSHCFHGEAIWCVNRARCAYFLLYTLGL
jgi:hypothetical protein